MSFWDFVGGAIGGIAGEVVAGPAGAAVGSALGREAVGWVREGEVTLPELPSVSIDPINWGLGESNAPQTEVEPVADFWETLAGQAGSIASAIFGRTPSTLPVIGAGIGPPILAGAGQLLTGPAARGVGAGIILEAVFDLAGNLLGYRKRRRRRRRRLTKGQIADLMILRQILGPRSPALTVLAMQR